MKYLLIILFPFVGCHDPSVWEITTQRIAHNGDTAKYLFDCMRRYDSIAMAKDLSVFDDSFIAGWQKYSDDYYKKLNKEQRAYMHEETKRWMDNQYSWAYDYFCSPSILGLNTQTIYVVPISWWKRPYYGKIQTK